MGGRPFTVTVTIRGEKPEGTAISHGGKQFGYALYFVGGRPAFALRDGGKLTDLVAKEPVSGKVTVTAKLDAKKLVLSVDGEEVASADSPGFLTQQPAIGMYLGQDFQDAVGPYQVPNSFNGKLLGHSVEVAAVKVSMRTDWGGKVTAENVWKEYPRPALRRENWTNLNGHWDYAVTPKSVNELPGKWDGRILVPFAIEAPLSGVEQPFTPEDALWYRRVIEVTKAEGKRYLLNFEAVDYESSVWVNGNEVGNHTGGNLPFSLDITDAVQNGENTIALRVTDATDSAYQLHGKQRLSPKGIWYTPVSGIWQTVWMEEVPTVHLTDIRVTTAIDGTVKLDLSVAGDESEFRSK